jgi:outer membrane protein assembly factor BamB
MKKTSLKGVLAAGAVLLGSTVALAQDWPQWRGPNRDNKVMGFTAPQTWPKELTQKWSVKVGAGDSSPVLVGDKLYVFARQDGDEVTSCLDAATGKVVWQDKYATQPATGPAGGIHAGPRSTPAVAEGKVCTLGVRGVLSCLDAASGKVIWRKDTTGDLPRFFTACSPLIVDGKCIAFVGALTAFDLAGGEVKWKWTGDRASYGSPVLMTVAGTKQIVTPAQRSLAGIGVADGKLLWQVAFGGKYNSSTPIIDGQTVIYSNPGGGTVAYQIEKTDDSFAAKQLWKKSQVANQYNTPVLKNGLLFGLAPAGRAATNFFCMSEQTGDVLWTDSTQRGQCGTILDAGPFLVALTSDANLVVFQPSKEKYMQVASYKVAETPIWAYPILAGNRVFVKDRDALTLWTIE